MMTPLAWVVYLSALFLATSAVQLNAVLDGSVSQPVEATAITPKASAPSQEDGMVAGISMLLAHKFVMLPLHYAFPQAAGERTIVMWNPTGVEVVALSGLATTVAMALVVLAAILSLYYFDRVFGKAVQEVLETVDRALIGVDVSFGSVRINPCSGWVKLEDLKVSNPVTGHQYKKDYLLKARKVLVDVDMLKLITSFGHVVFIEAVELIGVEVLVEKTIHSSNIQDVLRGISGKHAEAKDEHETEAPVKVTEAPSKPKPDEPVPKPQQGSKQQKSGTEVLLGRIELKDIRVRMELDDFSAIGADLAVADIEYKNFSEEVGKYGVDDAFVFILKTILKSVVRTMVDNSTVCCTSIASACKPSKKPPAAKRSSSWCPPKLPQACSSGVQKAKDDASSASCCVGIRDKVAGKK